MIDMIKTVAEYSTLAVVTLFLLERKWVHLLWLHQLSAFVAMVVSIGWLTVTLSPQGTMVTSLYAVVTSLSAVISISWENLTPKEPDPEHSLPLHHRNGSTRAPEAEK